MNNNSPNLDLLRAVAVGFVVLSHLGAPLGWNSEHAYSLEAFGRLGVAVFFVHTSLVLMLSLERQGGAAVPFFIRRFFRIYPLSVATVLLLAGLKWGRGIALEPGPLLSNLLLIQNISGYPSSPPALWSLPYEVQMYLFLPALYALTLLPRSLLLIALAWAGTVGLIVLAWVGAIDYDLVRFVPCFLAGVIAFILWRRPALRRLSPLVLLAVLLLAVVTIPALVAAGVPETPLLWVLCLALGVAIPVCRPITSHAVAKASEVIATYSYGIYLNHFLCIALGFGALSRFPAALQWGVFFAMLAGLSFAGYQLIERPGIALGVRLAARFGRAKPESRSSRPASVSAAKTGASPH